VKRSHEALRARDQGRAATTGPIGSLTPPESDWSAILRELHARLEPPSSTRPYWAVYPGRRFLAAARAPRDAIARALLTLDAPAPRA